MNARKKLKINSSENMNDSSESEKSTLVVSSYFHHNPTNRNNSVCDLLYNCLNNLNDELLKINFTKPVDCIYNPTKYAFEAYQNFIYTYCNSYKNIMYLGMNPGPWGMSQTGVPFGEVSAVKNYLKIYGNVLKPEKEHPLRPIEGYNCTRSEVSGKRFWNLVKELCGEPENFFRSSFVHNYCPLQLITSSGKNITPAELKREEKELLFNVCDKSLIEVINIYRINIIVCIGKFVEGRVIKIQKSSTALENIKVLTIPHPSPRAVGNTNWQNDTIKLMEHLGLTQYYTSQRNCV